MGFSNTFWRHKYQMLWTGKITKHFRYQYLKWRNPHLFISCMDTAECSGKPTHKITENKVQHLEMGTWNFWWQNAWYQFFTAEESANVLLTSKVGVASWRARGRCIQPDLLLERSSKIYMYIYITNRRIDQIRSDSIRFNSNRSNLDIKYNLHKYKNHFAVLCFHSQPQPISSMHQNTHCKNLHMSLRNATIPQIWIKTGLFEQLHPRKLTVRPWK